MNRRTKSIEQRNREIYADYIAHFRNGLPIMEIYSIIGYHYDLSEESIRKIVAQEAKG